MDSTKVSTHEDDHPATEGDLPRGLLSAPAEDYEKEEEFEDPVSEDDVWVLSEKPIIQSEQSHVRDGAKAHTQPAYHQDLPGSSGWSGAGVYTHPQHPKIFCDQCNIKPEGFRGPHELRRHVQKNHGGPWSVWVCVDRSHDKKFLSKCKACNEGKRYGAYYNATAHLRRIHFSNKKSSKSKGTTWGSDDESHEISMEVLKSWIQEVPCLTDSFPDIERQRSPESEDYPSYPESLTTGAAAAGDKVGVEILGSIDEQETEIRNTALEGLNGGPYHVKWTPHTEPQAFQVDAAELAFMKGWDHPDQADKAAEEARKAKEEVVIALEAEYAELERREAEREEQYQRKKNAEKEEAARKEAKNLKMGDEDMKRAVKVTNEPSPKEGNESADENDIDEGYTIKCICGFKNDDGNTVYCGRCDTWQHTKCYYLDENDVVPTKNVLSSIDHFCADCKPRPLAARVSIKRQVDRGADIGSNALWMHPNEQQSNAPPEKRTTRTISPYDTSDGLIRESPQVERLVNVQHSLSPTPERISRLPTSKRRTRRPKAQASQGDAVLIGFMGGLNHPDLALKAGEEPLDQESEDSTDEDDEVPTNRESGGTLQLARNAISIVERCDARRDDQHGTSNNEQLESGSDATDLLCTTVPNLESGKSPKEDQYGPFSDENFTSPADEDLQALVPQEPVKDISISRRRRRFTAEERAKITARREFGACNDCRRTKRKVSVLTGWGVQHCG